MKLPCFQERDDDQEDPIEAEKKEDLKKKQSENIIAVNRAC